VGALLVVDAILTGCGRTGIELDGAGCNPDLLCVGKALGSGVAASAVIARTDMAQAAWDIDGEAIHTSTFVGDAISCAGILHTIATLPSFDLGDIGTAWHTSLSSIAAECDLDLRGRGLLWALDTGIAGGGVDLARAVLNAGVLVVPSGMNGESITLLPSVISGDDARAALRSAALNWRR
jgi:acetylornithine/succinyldiaminopimelate/putrescine aminotransferase